MHSYSESRFLMKIVHTFLEDMKNLYRDNTNLGTVFGGSAVIVLAYVSHDHKLDMITIHLQRYRDDILNTIMSLHFDDHALATRPVFL